MIPRPFHISILTSRYVWLGLILITTGQRRNAHIKLGIFQFNTQLAVHRPIINSCKGRPYLLTSLCILSPEACIGVYKNQNHTGQFQLQSWLRAVSYIVRRLVERRKPASLIDCSECKVTLCAEYLVPFHTNPQLVDSKISTAIRFSSNDDGKE